MGWDTAPPAGSSRTIAVGGRAAGSLSGQGWSARHRWPKNQAVIWPPQAAAGV
jgi:hypothetical protein